MPKLSIVQRTFLQLALAIVLIFFVLALVYSLIFSAGFRNEQERQLSITAEVLAERLAGAWILSTYSLFPPLPVGTSCMPHAPMMR